MDHAKAIRMLNEKYHVEFKEDQPTVLIFGGSQGAKAINDNVRLPEIPEAAGLQVIHLAGGNNLFAIKDRYAALGKQALLLESSPDMNLFYNAADFIICRAGGSTVAEIACFGKYACLIPYPFAAELHQDDNAAWLASGGGAEILKNSTCTPQIFSGILERFLKDVPKYRELGKRSLTLASPDAAGNVISFIKKSLRKH